MPGKKIATPAVRSEFRQDPTLIPALKKLRQGGNSAWKQRATILLKWLSDKPGGGSWTVNELARDLMISATTVSKTLSGFVTYVTENAATARDADTLVASAMVRVVVPRGRPFHVVGEVRETIEASLRETGQVAVAAARAGLSRATVHRAIRADAGLKTALLAGRQSKELPEPTPLSAATSG